MLRLITAILATLTSLTWAAQPASAEEAVDPDSRMVLVLDSSGSMAEKTPDGSTRIAAAKDALRSVIGSLPQDQEVGLRVYGAKVFDRKDDGACTDSQLIVKPGTDNRDELEDALGDYEPYGETPIGYALQQAGKDLGSEGSRTIVLVSDGEPTCAPDPCVVAEKLSNDGIDVRIDVVGLDVSGAARDKLRCVAEKGNGTYYDADSADDLVESLDQSATRASRPFDLTGEPVEGTPDAADAPELSTGQYLDRIPLEGEIFYRVPRTVDASTIHVGLMNTGEPGSTGNGVRLTLYSPAAEGEDAPRQCTSNSSHDVSLGERRPFSFVSQSSWTSDPSAPCTTSSEILVGLERASGDIGNRPVEIAVYEEPPLADASARDLPPTPDEPEWESLEPGTPVDGVVPGTSIANAPLVEDGTYAFDINPGETQVVAVPLDWGQDVQAQLDARLTDDVLDAAAVGSDIVVDVIDPLRGDTGVSFFADEPDDWFTTALGNARFGDRRDFRTGAQTHTVAYLNRADSNPKTRAAQLAGRHYFRVRHNVRGEEANLKYTLTIKHHGTAGEGAPEYAAAKGLAAPTAESRLTVAPRAAVEEEERASADESGDGVPWLPIGLGGGGIALLGAAALVLRHARR